MAGALIPGGAGFHKEDSVGKSVKVYTTRGVMVKGKHIPAMEIVEMDEKDAGLVVGSNAGYFVGNEEMAREVQKRQKAEAAKKEAAAPKGGGK